MYTLTYRSNYCLPFIYELLDVIFYLEDMGGEADIAVHSVEGVHPLKVGQELDQLHLYAGKDGAHHLPHLFCYL